MQSMAKVSTVIAGSITFGVAVGPGQHIADQFLAKADVIRALHERVQLCQDRRQNLLSNKKVLASAASITFCECTATRSCRSNEPLVGQRSSRGSSQVSRKTAWYRPQSAQASPESGIRERETSRLPRTWEPSEQRNRASKQCSRVQSWLAFFRSNPWRLAWPQPSKQPPPPISAPLMTKTEPRQSCMFRRRLRHRKMRGSEQLDGCRGPSHLEHPSSASQDEDSEDMDFSAPRKSRLSAPQLQAQFSLLTDRTRRRRLRSTLLSKGAWQQITRNEDLCHTNVSHEWLYHLDACAGSVLTLHDYITNVQKRLGNRVWVGG